MNSINFEQIQLRFSLSDCKMGYSYSIEFSLENSEQFETGLIKSASEHSCIEFSKHFLCNYHFSKIQYFKVNVLRWKNRQHYVKLKVLDNMKLTLSTLVKHGIFETKINEKIQNCEKIIIKVENPNYSEEKKNNFFSFFDYIKAGVKLESYIGIDFTKGTEHNQDPDNNQYLQAILGFRETIFDFVRDFQVYGYGATLKNQILMNNPNYFNLSLSKNTVLTGYTNIEKAYKECLKQINYLDSCSLSPLLNNIKNIIYERYKPDIYSILFLLINDAPDNKDVQNTIDSFIENSYLPLSIIIIGIGNKELDGVKEIINPRIKYSSKDIERYRNNIYFISMKECNFNNDILKNKCLKDLPKQLVEYYSLSKTSPENVRENNFDSIKESINKIFNKNSLYGEFEDCPAPGLSIQEPNINIIEEDKKCNDQKISQKQAHDINKSKNYINETPGYEEKKENNYKQNPFSEKMANVTPKGDENNKKLIISNPFINKNKIDNIIINNNINNNKNISNATTNNNKNVYNNTSRFANETPNGDIKDKIPNQLMDNPFINKKKDEEEIKLDINNRYKINNHQINNINNEEKNYVNETPGNQKIQNNFNQLQDNPYKINNEQNNLFINNQNNDKNKISEEKKYINTPGNHKQININNQKYFNNQILDDKIFINTPGNNEKNNLNNFEQNIQNNISIENNNNNNPFVINNQQNNGKQNNNFIERPLLNNISQQNISNFIQSQNNNSIIFDNMKNNNFSNIQNSNLPREEDYSIDT